MNFRIRLQSHLIHYEYRPFRYPYNPEVGTYPYYPGTTHVHTNSINYDTDFVDSTTSTTTYDPRPGYDAVTDTGSLMTNVVPTGTVIMVWPDFFENDKVIWFLWDIAVMFTVLIETDHILT